MLPQLLVHLWADYIGQSDYFAMNKAKRSIPCLLHVLIYTSCFLLLTTSWKALMVIGITHYIIDRYPIIVKRLIWLKNHMNPQLTYVPFEYCSTTGYYDDCAINNKLPTDNDKVTYGNPRLFSITIWLYIITDNILHLTINYFALQYL